MIFVIETNYKTSQIRIPNIYFIYLHYYRVELERATRVINFFDREHNVARRIHEGRLNLLEISLAQTAVVLHIIPTGYSYYSEGNYNLRCTVPSRLY